MKTLLISVGLALGLIVIGAPPRTVDAQAADAFGFGYAQRATDGSWVLNVIDPAGEIAVKPLPLSIEGVLLDVAASPDGQWLMLYSVHQYESTIHVVNLLTGETQFVDRGRYYDDSTSEEFPRWSPDSQYLAYTNVFVESDVSDAYVYDVAEKSRSLVWGGYTPTYPYEVAWSPDGTQLALLVRRCTWQEGVIKDCGSSIERFSIPITVEEPAVFPYPQPLPRAILTYEYGRPCGLTWSPDGAFIAFRSSCGFVMSGVFNEVFMLDVAQSTIQQVTYLTNPAPLIDTIPLNYMNSYDFAWSADNQLLAGIVRALGIAVIDPVTFSAGSFAYPHPFVTPMSISTSVAREWARNPVDGMLAYRAEATQLNAENGLYDANRQTKIATYQTGTLTEIAAGTPGCDYRWSPDGAHLMYRGVSATTPGVACSMSNTFVLYQSASSSFSTYAVDDYVWPAGWVVLPDSPQS